MTVQPPGAPPEGHDAGTGTVPTCYRHPGRETYLRCSRCDRPICPDCMRDAPVGQQCVECVREANRQTPPARTVFGGVTVSGRTWVTWAFLAANIVVYLAQLADPGLVNALAVWGFGIEHGQWYRLITGTFLHQAIWHIGVNMYALFVIGPHLERILGHWRYALLYLAAGVCGSALSVIVLGTHAASLGASGSIFGLFGATFIVFRRLRLQTGWILSTIAINLVITFLFSRFIDWRGHVGGLIAGCLIALAYAYAPRAARLPVQVGTALLLLVVALAAVAVRV